MADRRPWRPLLAGTEAQAARGLASRIGHGLLRLPTDQPGLAAGKAGLALCFRTLDRAFPGGPWGEAAAAHHQHAARALADGAIRSPWLADGFAGAGFAFALDDPEGGIDLDDIDQAIALAIERFPPQGPFCLHDGLVGLGVYLLERAPRAIVAAAALDRLIQLLEARARASGPGHAWLTPPAHVWPDRLQPRYPRGHYVLGAARGNAGVLSFLSSVQQVRPSATCARLAAGVADWLVDKRLPSDYGCWFGMYAREDGQAERTPPRSAWCSGDPGIAAALLRAGQAFDVPAWRDLAVQLGRAVASREIAALDLLDACLCHGWMGVAHSLNRLHLQSGDPALAEGARALYAHVLETAAAADGASDGIAGLRFFRVRWSALPDLLAGAAGVCLALLAATESDAPDWDRLLLLSDPAVPS